MKKILVLFTGGTIGSITTDGIIDVEREGKYAVVEAYKSAYGDEIGFECRQVLNILSENMGFSGWEKMIHEINSIDTALYSGVILTHGSDTLAYTSALLGMYFRHFDIPLFIIASNKPIGEKGSNGLFNFTSAVGLIKEGKYKGVFTLYERVMLPTRVIPADTCRDRFGVYGYDGFNDFSVFSGVSENMLSRPRERIFHNDVKFGKRVLFIEGYPAMDFGCFVPNEDTAAVLYSPYHSSTACTDVSEGKSYALTEFIQAVHNKEHYGVYLRSEKKSAYILHCGGDNKGRQHTNIHHLSGGGLYETSACLQSGGNACERGHGERPFL